MRAMLGDNKRPGFRQNKDLPRAIWFVAIAALNISPHPAQASG
jgi:hypothetical protein